MWVMLLPVKGIIAAGGTGSRLSPLTKVVNKHLLPVYNKPMIYYPLTTLILSGVTEIAIACNADDKNLFMNLLGDGGSFGVNLSYFVQQEPDGIVGAIKSCSGFIEGENFTLVLGDNLIYGTGFGRSLSGVRSSVGATIFAYSVANPADFGVVQFDASDNPIALLEKPRHYISSWAIPGLYFYDDSVLARIEKLEKSSRGELEITSLNQSFLDSGDLTVIKMPLGVAWLDLGTPDALIKAGSFIQLIEERQGIRVGDPIEASREV
jgi:glucose-1-phosphate thymidylyltransferase